LTEDFVDVAGPWPMAAYVYDSVLLATHISDITTGSAAVHNVGNTALGGNHISLTNRAGNIQL